jgi:hypothetical protein
MHVAVMSWLDRLLIAIAVLALLGAFIWLAHH